jgi:antitoxin (DNA-binding transcriptional repressor) of toxin-antitoxin stability system
MKRVSTAEAQNDLSSLIASLGGGASVLIVDRGQPVARLEPVSGAPAVLKDDRLMRLVGKGIVRPARVTLPKSLFSTRLPTLRSGTSALSALLEERRKGR